VRGRKLTLALALCFLSLPGGTSLAGEVPYVLESDVPYTTPFSQPAKNLLDVYSPARASRRKAPVLLWVHGGGWYQGTKESAVLGKARRFTAAGYVFVSINYRLSPRVGDADSLVPGRVMFPDQPRDVARAIGWVSRNIGRYGGDRRRMVLMGHSAGGQIVSLLATRPRFLAAVKVGQNQIRGVISLDSVGFNVTDLTDPASPYRTEDQKPSYWNVFGTPAENEDLDRWHLASPLEHAGPRDPPFFFVVPNDVAVRIREAKQMARRLYLNVDRSVRLVSKTHGQINHSFGYPAGRGETAAAMRFARAATSRSGIG